MNTFMLFRENREYGPYTFETIKALLASGNVSKFDYVRSLEAAEWSQIDVLFPTSAPVATSTPPPFRPDIPTISGEWYYDRNGERVGPIGDGQLRQLLARGIINNTSLVWKKGFDNWTPIAHTEHKQTLVTPPPLAGHVVNSGIVWVIAFLPLVRVIIRYWIAGILQIGPDDVVGIGFVVMIANVTLAYIDDIRLKRAGHDTEKFGGWVWLVPVYLFKRAKALNQSLAYFITWVICFFISVVV